MAAAEKLEKLLADTSDTTTMRELIAPDVTCSSLAVSNPALTEVIPWAGTHEKTGPYVIIKTVADVAWFWEILEFDIEDIFGDETNAACFGRFTFKSQKLQQTVNSPFAVFIKLNQAGLISYMQFMENTLATTASFRKSGKWVIESDPDGGSVEI